MVGDSESPELRGLFATYATGFFSLSLVPMTSLVVPLWALSIGATPALIGIIVASRSVLPFFLSIHGGAMMDRLGTRRMMLIFTAAGALVSLLYPLSTRIGVLIALQLFVGWAQGMGWIGAQTKIARLTGGNTTYAAHFSFVTTCGTFLGPLIAGVTWDAYGPWGAFVLIALWGGCLTLASYLLPAAGQRAPVRLRWRELLPQPADYWRAFALLSIPGVALVVGATFLRISAFSIQGSFYTVYLQGVGLSGTSIGILVGVASLIGGPAALLTGLAAKAVRPHWLLLGSIALAVIFISITPLLHGFVPLLIAAGIFGLGLGMGLPLLLSILSDAISTRDQGISVGLRTTANRLASIVLPVAMGLVIEVTGIEYGFYAIGLALLAAVGLAAWLLHRSAALPSGERSKNE
ncbi:MAG: MFS transporter [Burkholderiales bacterium]|nr:MFS transporter [Burkholderiales bacterium]